MRTRLTRPLLDDETAAQALSLKQVAADSKFAMSERRDAFKHMLAAMGDTGSPADIPDEDFPLVVERSAPWDDREWARGFSSWWELFSDGFPVERAKRSVAGERELRSNLALVVDRDSSRAGRLAAVVAVQDYVKEHAADSKLLRKSPQELLLVIRPAVSSYDICGRTVEHNHRPPKGISDVWNVESWQR
jgi:hypothetical protein